MLLVEPAFAAAFVVVKVSRSASAQQHQHQQQKVVPSGPDCHTAPESNLKRKVIIGKRNAKDDDAASYFTWQMPTKTIKSEPT